MLIVLRLGEICEELILEDRAPRGIIVAEVNAEDRLWMEEDLRPQMATKSGRAPNCSA